MCVLWLLIGDNQQHFHHDILSVLRGRAKLPLGERVQHKFRLRELRRKEDGERLEAACLTDKPMNHEGIGIDCAGRDVGPYDVIRPGRLDMRDIARGSRAVGPGKRVLEDPALRQANMQINGI